MLATIRALGIPARYTSGYLNQNFSRPMSQSQSMGGMSQSQEMISEDAMLQSLSEHPLRGTGASHAWCEVYLGPEVGWRGFDAANNLLADQNFVRIGAGRDFRDITPVKGVHKGSAEEDLKVTVSVSRVA